MWPVLAFFPRHCRRAKFMNTWVKPVCCHNFIMTLLTRWISAPTAFLLLRKWSNLLVFHSFWELFFLSLVGLFIPQLNCMHLVQSFVSCRKNNPTFFWARGVFCWVFQLTFLTLGAEDSRRHREVKCLQLCRRDVHLLSTVFSISFPPPCTGNSTSVEFEGKLTCVRADCKLLLDSATVPYWTVTVLAHSASNAPCWPKGGLSHNPLLTSSLLIATFCREEGSSWGGSLSRGPNGHWDSVV